MGETVTEVVYQVSSVQLDMVNQQLTTTNEYLSTIVIALLYICVLATFFIGYYITKGRG